MLKKMDPTHHVVMPKSWRMWLGANLTSVGLGTLYVYYKSTWSLSHSKFACLLTLIIAFYSLQWNRARRLFKTHAFMVMWSWCLKPSSQVDGHLSLFGSKTTLLCTCKCHTKLYLVISNASHHQPYKQMWAHP